MKASGIKVIEILISLSITVLFSYLYISENPLLEEFNLKISDIYYKVRGEIKPSDNIIIVDIDEKSLGKLGQWPWSRDKMAKIIANLTDSGVGIIGLDIVFAEEDNSSPDKVLKRFAVKFEGVENYDEILAKIFLSSPLVAGYMFDFKEKIKRGIVPNIPVIIIQKGYGAKEFLPKAKGVVSNISVLQKNAYSSGFFNTIPDSDAVVRSVPLLVKYENGIYPSLSLEILRAVYGADKIVIDYSQNGISSVSLGDKEIKTDRFARLRLKYYGKSKLFRYISAYDIYNGNFKKDEIEGRIVLIGTSAGGLLDLRATPFESTYAGVEIHATAIENILDSTYVSNPVWMEGAELSLLIVLSLALSFILMRFGAVNGFLAYLFFILLLEYAGYYLFVKYNIELNTIYPLSSLTCIYLFLSIFGNLLKSNKF